MIHIHDRTFLALLAVKMIQKYLSTAWSSRLYFKFELKLMFTHMNLIFTQTRIQKEHLNTILTDY